MLINCVVYQDGKKLADISVDDISDYVTRDDCFVWVALLDATDAIIFRQLAMPESTIGFDPRRYFSALLNTLTR